MRSMPSILEQLDHLVYATPDLLRTVDDFADRLEVLPSAGGRHPSWGTRNALLALGPRMYLEIVGPDIDPPSPPRPRPFNLDGLDRPRLVTWACRADDLDDLVRRAKRAGVDLGEVQAGSRRRPDGTTISWSMTDLTMPREGGVVPFFINWGDSNHPAEAAPVGCTLEDLRVEHPEPDRLSSILSVLGVDVPVYAAERAGLGARIAGPRGTIDLSS
jgi:hypothetical protein